MLPGLHKLDNIDVQQALSGQHETTPQQLSVPEPPEAGPRLRGAWTAAAPPMFDLGVVKEMATLRPADNAKGVLLSEAATAKFPGHTGSGAAERLPGVLDRAGDVSQGAAALPGPRGNRICRAALELVAELAEMEAWESLRAVRCACDLAASLGATHQSSEES